MSNFNRLILMGRITRDVEVRTTSGGTTVGKFGIAVNSFRGKDKPDAVLFLDCVAFGRTAENIGKFFKKGSAIHLEGRLEFSQWEDKNGGGKRSKHEMLVDSFQFMPGGDDANPSKGSASPDEVPF